MITIARAHTCPIKNARVVCHTSNTLYGVLFVVHILCTQFGEHLLSNFKASLLKETTA